MNLYLPPAHKKRKSAIQLSSILQTYFKYTRNTKKTISNFLLSRLFLKLTPFIELNLSIIIVRNPFLNKYFSSFFGFLSLQMNIAWQQFFYALST